ncbi:MAG: phospholipase D-like domain-containing protein [Lentimicrobium sp.]
MIIYGTNLINKIRTEFDKATNRIWIAVPFIGEWSAVKKIMGTKWIGDNNLKMKILTDIRNDDFINPETIKQFLHKGEVKTLPGLHAKIYIIDNSVFITSANLTGTAFSKRYEICEYFTITDKHDILDVFNEWWGKSKNVDINWQPTKNKDARLSDNDAGNTFGLEKLWNLPESSITVRNFKDYQDNILLYNHFLKIYNSDGDRLLPKLTKYHELDAILNYLFHEDANTPSHEYLEKQYRKLTDNQRILEIRRYKTKFKKWLKTKPTFEDYRNKRILLVQNKLDTKNIFQLDANSLTEVVDTLHTMNSHALNRFKFLNPGNNKLETVRDSFNILLHDSRPIEERMELCNMSLKSFGKSSIRELVSWYYPDKYPIMNRNSNCGLKFFGYDIDTY